MVKAGSDDGGDFAEASATEIGPDACTLVRNAWAEWQQYRQRRHRSRGAARLLWTAQAARLSAAAILKAAQQHGAEIVADRITSAISGEWKALNFDTMASPALSPSVRRRNEPACDFAPDPNTIYGF